jgi:hypothetical protein
LFQKVQNALNFVRNAIQLEGVRVLKFEIEFSRPLSAINSMGTSLCYPRKSVRFKMEDTVLENFFFSNYPPFIYKKISYFPLIRDKAGLNVFKTASTYITFEDCRNAPEYESIFTFNPSEIGETSIEGGWFAVKVASDEWRGSVHRWFGH